MSVKIFEPSSIIEKENIKFGEFIIIDDFVKIHAKSKIILGNHIHIGSYSSLMASGAQIKMDDFSGLSFGVRLVTSSDDFSSYGFGNPTISLEYRNVKSGEIHIGKFSIIGTNSIILPGVKIPEGCAVSAGSVVTKSLKPWGIYNGNRRVGDRDKEGILKNYEKFLSTNINSRIGRVFKLWYMYLHHV